MKKKSLVIFFAIMSVFALAFGLTACSSGNNENDSHVHTYAEEWTYDATHHWHVATCGHTDEVSGKVEHTWENGYCSVCGRKYPSVSGVGLEYTLSDKGTYYSVTGIGTCEDRDVIIPSTYSDKPVKSIGEGAFSGCSSLTSITIPDGVTTIDKIAFFDCISLTSVTIGNSVTSIGESAFKYCYKLIEVKNLSSLTINAGSEDNGYVGYYAKRVYKEGESCLSTDENGYIIYSEGTDKFLVGYVGTETKLTLPNGIPQIYQYAFSDRRSFTSVTIGNSVTSIGDWAFSWCSNLTSITIPDGVTSIGDRAFVECSNLTSVTIGNSVTSIGDDAFSGCSSLTSINVGENNQSYKSIDGNLYTKDGATLIQYAKGKTETSFVIPESVTSIGDDAFNNCSSLTSVVIPDSVTSIGDSAFYDCDSLTSVTFKNTSGWWYASSSTASSGTSISSTDLADPSTAATYLKTTYCDYYWKRS